MAVELHARDRVDENGQRQCARHIERRGDRHDNRLNDALGDALIVPAPPNDSLEWMNVPKSGGVQRLIERGSCFSMSFSMRSERSA